jgi:hypothetical protein
LPVAKSPEPLKIDEGDNGDWIKRGSWDIPATNLEELRKWIAAGGHDVEWFKRLPVYQGNLERLP